MAKKTSIKKHQNINNRKTSKKNQNVTFYSAEVFSAARCSFSLTVSGEVPLTKKHPLHKGISLWTWTAIPIEKYR
jgi:hypothetical protein